MKKLILFTALILVSMQASPKTYTEGGAKLLTALGCARGYAIATFLANANNEGLPFSTNSDRESATTFCLSEDDIAVMYVEEREINPALKLHDLTKKYQKSLKSRYDATIRELEKIMSERPKKK